MGWKEALRSDAGFLKGLNTWNGRLTCPSVAGSQGRAGIAPEEAVN